MDVEVEVLLSDSDKETELAETKRSNLTLN